MADFTALKAAINAAIKTNGEQEITGAILQTVLDAIVETLGDGAINDLITALSNEATARGNADATLGGSIDGLATSINAINTKLTEGYIYAGIATPSTIPGTPSGKVFYIATAAGEYTNFLDANSAALVLTQGINILKFNGTAWNVEQVWGVDDVPTVGSNNIVKSGGVQNELALGAVYDISAKNPTAGPDNDGKWESLSALLSDANLNTLIPTGVRKGGMSIKFVCTYDNKYVQYRLMADEWSVDTEDWAICSEDVLVENPEYIRVYTDKDGRILFGIKADASIEWAVGVPTPVKDYILAKVDEINSDISDIVNGTDTTNIDGLNKIISFLDDFSTSNTLKSLLDTKVDKVEGKSLSTNDYTDDEKEITNSFSLVENLEYLNVETDAEDRILGGRKADGTKFENTPLETFMSVIDSAYDNEFAEVHTDEEGRILYGVKKNGEFVWSKGVMSSEAEKEFIADAISSFPKSKYLPLLSNLKRPIISTNSSSMGPVGRPATSYIPLSLAVLADIHGNTYQMGKFVEFADKYKDYLDNSIILGDIVGSVWTNYVDSWDDMPGYNRVLKVLGNHDIYEYSAVFTVSGVDVVPTAGAIYKESTHTHTVIETNIVNGSGTIRCLENDYSVNAQSGTLTKLSGTGDDSILFSASVLEDAPVDKCFERYFKDIASWGVEYTQDKCYYYKDYAKAKIRLIVLDCMHITEEQTAWLTEVLMGENNANSALSLGLHVIIAQHIPTGTKGSDSVTKINVIESNFTTKEPNPTYQTTAYTAVIGVVDSFQQAGGVFVTYIAGHWHWDVLLGFENYPNQTMIVFPSGSGEGGYWKDVTMPSDTSFENQFTVLSVDTQTKYIRMLRIGATCDRNLIPRESIVISYEDNDRKIIY